jgi:succinate-semialdehyde dehydrogenase/glutarate-semialdehyde dehydrogenase
MSIIVTSPATGERVGEVPLCGADDVNAAVAKARAAQADWAQQPVSERARVLKAVRGVLLKRSDDLAELISHECSKPRAEAVIHGVAPVTLSLTWLVTRGHRLLAPESPTALAPMVRGTKVHRRPRGVVGLISPWNFPFTIPFTSVAEALLAGNGVVVKPSEHSPLIAQLGQEIFEEGGVPRGLLNVVTGDASTGEALIEADVDMVVFTGSVKAGRKIAARCGERLIPCVMELGGKAPLVALDDCDLERTAAAVAFGGFANSGQICISVERVIADAKVHDELLELVLEHVATLRQGDPAAEEVDVGALVLPNHADHLDALLTDATEAGARVLCGGTALERGRQFFPPTVLADVTPQMRVFREETFGPIVSFVRAQSVDEAVALANDSELGLSAYVFGKDRKRARAVAGRIRAGAISINDVFTQYAAPELPFGGMGASGFGRVHGPEGLLAMTTGQTIADDRVGYAPARDLWWFPYSNKATEGIMSMLRRVINILDVTARR